MIKRKYFVKNVDLAHMHQHSPIEAISTSNMMEKHHRRTNFIKIQDLMGIEANGQYQISIKQDENILDNKNKIKLISWNVGSLKQSTFEIIKQETVHLLCLQEVRNQYISDSVKYKYYYNKRDTSNSGGIIIGVHQQFQSKNITAFYFNNDSDEDFILPEVLVVQIINPILNLVLINVYFHNQSEYKKCRLYFWEKVTGIVNQLSNNQQLVICGDFNYEDLGVGFMIDTVQDKITFRRKQLHRTLSSVTDHILILREVNHSASQMWMHSFDHCILRLEFQANILCNERVDQNEYCTVSKEKAIKCCQSMMLNENIRTFQNFYSKYKTMLWKKRIISKNRIRIQPVKYQRINNYFDKLKICLKNDKNEFFNILKTTLILHQQRRDGGIFNCFINDNKQLCTGKEIFINCIKILDKFSSIQQYCPKPIPQLPELSQEEIEYMQKRIALDKAISFDGISHQFVKLCNWNIINDIWNEKTFVINKKLGWVRLCPLNKCYPEIPLKEQFRPLVIMSPLLKFMELRFYQKLQDYLRYKILKPQTGFISGMSTHVNIFLMLNWIKQMDSKNKKCLIFIDFTSAYNTIDRQRLYGILKQTLDDQEVDYLEAIHSRIVYVDAYNLQNKIYFKNGVPQGSPISPDLFNIYLDEFLKDLLQTTGNSFQFLGYADDLVLLTEQKNLGFLLPQLKNLSSQWNLRINNKKCGIMAIRRKIKQESICEFPVVQKYKYLGIDIDYNGTTLFHVENLATKINFLNYKLCTLSTTMEFAQRLFLYRVYIEPYFLYQSVASSFDNKSLSQKVVKLRKKSFKQIMRLPPNTPDIFLRCFLTTYQSSIKDNLMATLKKIADRGIDHQLEELRQIAEDIKQPELEIIPINFQLLFKFAWAKCPKHDLRCTFKHILTNHLSLTEDDLVSELLTKLKDKEFKVQMEKALENLKLEVIIENSKTQKYKKPKRAQKSQNVYKKN